MLKSLQKKRDQGFTIIEVMIVLAIAGLILVVVLIAIPQLQRNQRNSARQQILSRVSTELSSYAGSNSGAFPAAATADSAGNFGSDASSDTASFIGKYIKGTNVNDPSTGSPMTFVVGSPGTAPTQGQIRYVLSAECGVDGSMTALSGQNRKFALAVGLEGGRAYCLDNK